MRKTRLLIATCLNYVITPTFRSTIEVCANEMDIEVISKSIPDTVSDIQKDLDQPRLTKYEFERQKQLQNEGFSISETIKYQKGKSSDKIFYSQSDSLSLHDFSWADCSLFVIPTYHKTVPPRVRNLLEVIGKNGKRLLYDKPISGILVSNKEDDDHAHIFRYLYDRTLSFGAFPIAAPPEESVQPNLPICKHGYKHVVGNHIDIAFITEQIRRLVQFGDYHRKL